MNKNNNNLSDEIKNIVQDALNKGDFKRLNDDIKNVAKGALEEVKKSIDWKPGNNNERDSRILKEQKLRQENLKKQINNNYNNVNNSNNSYNRVYNQSKLVPKVTKVTVPMGQVSGVLLTIFGILGSTAFGIAVTVLTLLGFFIGGRGVFHTIAMGLSPLLIGSIIMSMGGNRINKRLKRFQKYISLMQGRNYALIADFSSATGLNDKSTVKDLRKMIDIGMFPQGHIDEQKTCFMLDNQCYGEYLKLQKDMKMKELAKQEELKLQIINQTSIQGKHNVVLTPEIRKSIDEGRQFVFDIKVTNMAIPGEKISLKLDRLEEVTGRIYDYVEIHPEKFPEIKKFAEYFLPTTLKLLDAYSKFDNQPVQGDNILSAKKEIEDTMDTINLAFENLFDGLFEDAAMDVSTDISVLETMFAQEGLTVNEMRVKNMTLEDENE